MAEPKAKTLQQKLGFFDEDLKSPTHDEILKWLDKNLLSFIHSIYSLKSWNQKHVKQVKEKAEKLVFVSIAKYKDKVIKTTEQIRKQEDEIKYNEERLLQHKGEDDDFYSELYGKKIDELKTEIKNLGTELSRLEKQLVYLENWAGLGEVPVRREIEITHRPWEFPVVSQSSGGTSGYKSGKNIIGFIDLKISFLKNKYKTDQMEVHRFCHNKSFKSVSSVFHYPNCITNVTTLTHTIILAQTLNSFYI